MEKTFVKRLWKHLNWRLFVWKIRFQVWCIDLKSKRLRKKYCHKGIHKVHNTYVKYGTNNKLKRIDFLTCQYCNYKLFANDKHLEEYKKYESSAKESISASVKRLFVKKSNTQNLQVASKQKMSRPVKNKTRRVKK